MLSQCQRRWKSITLDRSWFGQAKLCKLKKHYSMHNHWTNHWFKVSADQTSMKCTVNFQSSKNKPFPSSCTLIHFVSSLDVSALDDRCSANNQDTVNIFNILRHYFFWYLKQSSLENLEGHSEGEARTLLTLAQAVKWRLAHNCSYSGILLTSS